MFTKIKNYFLLVKPAHLLFTLPFALVGYFVGLSEINNNFDLKKLILVLLAILFAHNSAMAFNRYADKKIDSINPRTANREIPSGKISVSQVLLFIIVNIILFITTAAFINPLCFYLSPLALLIILSYSYFKRFTWGCHLVLGLSVGIAPVAAYIAVTGNFSLISILLSLLTLFWSAGFDIIYSLQDIEFDKKNNIKSIPAKFGIKRGLAFSTILHFIAMILAWYIYFIYNGSILFFIGTLIFSIMLIYQHIIVNPKNLSSVNTAFFNANSIASISYAFFVMLDFLIKY